MEILENLEDFNKSDLHHAYLIEGEYERVLPGLLKFIESLGVKTSGNPDFCHIKLDSFKIEDAKNLKSVEYEKSFVSGKKIFVISANNFLLEAQNTLLKIFEEPIENTHFFLIVPDKNFLLKTFVSRFYVVSDNKTSPQSLSKEELEVGKFLKMSLKERLDFIKELLAEPEENGNKEETDLVQISNARSKSLKFLNALEFTLHEKLVSRGILDTNFEHFFKVREFLNQPGSSVKSLMESVALVAPSF